MNHDEPAPIPAAADRRRDLLVDRALQGLDPAEAAELARLPAGDDGLEIELAAAAAALAGIGPTGHPDLPAGLAARVERQARARLRPPARPARRLGARVAPWLGWAAAAAVAVALVRDRAPLGPAPAPSRIPVAPPARDPLAAAPTARLVATAHPLARGAGGAVAWDAARQEGALRIDGLAPVDPRTGCYQLWIFDASRDPRYPVDGGIFGMADAPAGRVVPVRPRIPVRAPTLFAVTLEPPGGVVVSDRERILLTAAWKPPPPPAR